VVSIPEVTSADVGVIGTYVVVLLLPGGLLGLLAGQRGWTLAASAPLFTYAIAGLAGPLVPWSPLTFALATVAVCVLVAAVRFLLRGSRPVRETAVPPWARTAQAGVALSVVTAVGVGALAILGGIRNLGAIPQDWDAVFHANGVRLIAETGNGGLFAMATTNWYENDVTVFYPNAYHLVAAAVFDLTGASVPTVLNAHTVLIPGLLALSLAAMVRRFGGRPLLAAATALAAVSITAIYDMLWRGPLLPFATGVALTPVIVVVLVVVLVAPGLRAGLRSPPAWPRCCACTPRSSSARSCSACPRSCSAGGSGRARSSARAPCSWCRASRRRSPAGCRWRARSAAAAASRPSPGPL
jgi:hypothetical protein